ncbi:DUF998 domain-containing protein [Monashia sp. NPDC004114]
MTEKSTLNAETRTRDAAGGLATRTLATYAAVSLAVFPAVVVLLNLIQAQHYSARAQAMSELALGRGGSLMFAAFSLMGAGTLMLALLLHRELPRAKVAYVALILAAVLDVLSAIFHTNRANGPATVSSNIHMIAGICTYALVVLAMFSTVRHLRRTPRWTHCATPTLVWSVVALATFFLVPVLGDDSFGLAQRIFVATWLSWMIVTAILARRPGSHPPTAPGR